MHQDMTGCVQLQEEPASLLTGLEARRRKSLSALKYTAITDSRKWWSRDGLKVKDRNRLQVDTNRAMKVNQLLWLMIIIVSPSSLEDNYIGDGIIG